MSEQQSASARLARWSRVLVGAWLIFLSGMALRDHVTLADYRKSVTQVEPTRSEVSALRGRVASVEGAVDTLKRQPPSVTTGALEATRASLAARLTALEDRVGSVASEDDLDAAKARLTRLEERQQLHISQSPSMPPSSVRRAASAALSPDPPFKALSLDWRGGERFLALTLQDGHASEPLRLLRVGDRLTDVPGDWQLQALEGNAAVFVSQGRERRISIP